jgi:3-oxoacyl-[acyl-carrier protein] reductase
MLQNKTAIIYGAGGSLGGAVARAFASAGAQVFLTGRNLASIQQLAGEIGGNAVADKVDAMNEKDIENHMESVLQKAGRVDISFNAVGIDVKQNIPLVDLAVDDYVDPIARTMHTRFLTAVAAGRVMMKQGSGIILSLTATPGGIGYPFTGGFAPACCAVENLAVNLAAELGIYGVRVVNIRSGGSPDSRVFKEAMENDPEAMQQVIKRIEADTMLKKMPLMQDIANTAVFLASDMANKISGVTIDVTCGTTTALNHHITK